MPMKRFAEFKSYLKEEFVSHLPFTLIGVVAGMAFVFGTMRWGGGIKFGEEEFHWAHVAHIFFSAAAAAAIFKSYHDSPLKAVPVAALSAIVLCSLSDVAIPYAGLRCFGYTAHLHVCLLEHPVRVVASALAGVGAGLLGTRFFGHCNQALHLLHILIATAASTLYLLSFVPVIDARAFAVILVTLFLALVIPCLTGDVAVPMLFVHLRDEYSHEKMHHSNHKH